MSAQPNYYRMPGFGDCSPSDPDDRWEEIAERLESEYATGDKLREIAEDEFNGLNVIADLVSIYEGHVDDIPVASERLVRNLLRCLEDRIKREARQDAEREVERMDAESEEARWEARDAGRDY